MVNTRSVRQSILTNIFVCLPTFYQSLFVWQVHIIFVFGLFSFVIEFVYKLKRKLFTKKNALLHSLLIKNKKFTTKYKVPRLILNKHTRFIISSEGSQYFFNLSTAYFCCPLLSESYLENYLNVNLLRLFTFLK